MAEKRSRNKSQGEGIPTPIKRTPRKASPSHNIQKDSEANVANAASTNLAKIERELTILHETHSALDPIVPKARKPEIVDAATWRFRAKVLGNSGKLDDATTGLFVIGIREQICLSVQTTAQHVIKERNKILKAYDKRRRRARRANFVAHGALPAAEISLQLDQQRHLMYELTRLTDLTAVAFPKWRQVVVGAQQYISGERSAITKCTVDMSDWEEFGDNKRQVSAALVGIWISAASLSASLLFDHGDKLLKLGGAASLWAGDTLSKLLAYVVNTWSAICSSVGQLLSRLTELG